ncbi:MAG: TrmJ/YjtD family RNA methyltransferase [Treponema sp.]|nr:TrmJ/YjtD family RNA methyltransferase [Treponema sp.]
MILQDIRIILCNVSESGNVGAVCRVMKNMGLSQLRIVTNSADSPDQFNTEQIFARAVHAKDIWDNASMFDNLSDAVSDCSIVAGATRRRGHHRKNISMTPRDLSAWLKERTGKAAIVFGNERTGLKDCELELCNFATHIPVCEDHPSLNLSHAVQIYAYELFLAMEKQLPVKGEWQAMNQVETAALVDSIADILESVGFYKYPNRDMQTRFLHDVISRAGLTEREGGYLKEIIIKAARLQRFT